MLKRSEGTYSILEIYRLPSRRYLWRLKDGHNGEKIARSSQAKGFATARACFENAVGTTIRLCGGRGMLLPARIPQIGSSTDRRVDGQRLIVRRLG